MRSVSQSGTEDFRFRRSICYSKQGHCAELCHQEEKHCSQCSEGLLTLDVVPEDLPVALGTSLSKSLSSLAAARHDCKADLRAVEYDKGVKMLLEFAFGKSSKTVRYTCSFRAVDFIARLSGR